MIKTANTPSSPKWLHRRDWAKGEIAALENAPSTIGLGIVGLGLILGSLWILFYGKEFDSDPSNRPVKWILLAIGTGIMLGAFYVAFFRRKFGKTTLKLNSIPGIVGGIVDGTINIGARLDSKAIFQVRLQCLKLIPSRGKNNPPRHEILWESPFISVRTEGESISQTHLPVSFQIPADCAETGDKAFSQRIFWQMEAKADLPGLDYIATFEVPVLKVNEEDRSEVVRDHSENLKHI